MDRTATIFALSSGSLPSGVAVIRLSGADARTCLVRLCKHVPAPRQLALRDIVDGEVVIDRGLVAYFPAPHSFTGEDCAELHLHGGKAVVAAVLRLLGSMPHTRQAEAGEFTRRAFLNGKLDLTAAEALGDLIEAETEHQRRLAMRNASGVQRALYDGWRRRLLHARAMIEAELDFADESDVPGSVSASVWADIRALDADIAAHLEGAHAGEIVREGFRIVLIGAPNAGKSTLLNALAGRDVAIVTEEPGTTRDVLDVSLDLGGAKVVLSDTAGIRDGAGRVEALGIARARQAAAEADLVLLLDDGCGDGDLSTVLPAGVEMLRVHTKSDLRAPREGVVGISALTGAGLPELLDLLSRFAVQKAVSALDGVVPTTARHGNLLAIARSGLTHSLNGDAPLEIRAEGLRVAGDAVGRLTGAIGTEEVLGEIFSSFCIGK